MKQPNQYTLVRRILYWIKSTRLYQFIKRHIIFQSKLVALSILILGIYTAGQLDRSEHIVNADTITNTIIQKESTNFPILEKIASCESGGKQFRSNGDVVRGKINPSDIGKYQINEYINNDKARRLGFDIYTEQGNHDMAVYLFTNYGTEPWNSSKACWSK